MATGKGDNAGNGKKAEDKVRKALKAKAAEVHPDPDALARIRERIERERAGNDDEGTNDT